MNAAPALVTHGGAGTILRAAMGTEQEQAAEQVVMETLPRLAGQGGLIGIDAQGHIVMPFNTEGMYRGFIRVGQPALVAIYRD